MRNIKLIIEYDGKGFGGWQKQPNYLNIQGEIEMAIQQITGEEVELIGSGRTDAGVHSLGQTANFKTNSEIPIEKIPLAINSKLKHSIRIKKAEEVEERFHARYHCKGKKYRYILNSSLTGSAIYRGLEYHVSNHLDIQAMRKAAHYLEGEHDFTSFRASGTSSKNSVRTIYKIEVIPQGERIFLEFTGSGFLYNMVRILSGTLVEVGMRKNKTRRYTDHFGSKESSKSWKNTTGTRTLFGRSILLREILVFSNSV